MSVSTRRVVLTGIGIVNPLGEGVGPYWEALSRGESGVRPIQRFECAALPTRFAGQVANFDAKKYLEKKDRKSLRVMARAIQMAVAAAQMACDDAKVDKEKIDPAASPSSSARACCPPIRKRSASPRKRASTASRAAST